MDTKDTIGRPSASERAKELLNQREGRLPVYVRAPGIGTEHYTGLSRGKLYELASKGKIRSCSLREPGQANGTRLFHLGSILAYIESLIPAEPSGESGGGQ